MKMDLKLDILTLNCWGIVGISRHRKQRMDAIASHIATSNYDFVFLQEIWSQNDYNLICKKVTHALPYSYYFFSLLKLLLHKAIETGKVRNIQRATSICGGVLGSGICIFSKSTIVDAALFQFSLNGYAHKILHGDWYGGKGVGLCKVIHHGLKINLYVTHLHAEYDSFHDQYLPHRVAQAFEFSQFVQMTSETADLSIVAGDFNTESTDLPYKMIIHNTGCVDTYLIQKNSVLDQKCIKTTCGHPDNLYTSQKELSQSPTGKRIDYILYKCGTGTQIECLSYDTPLSKIPGTSIPYSDHEAVIAKLHIFKSIEAPLPLHNPKARVEAINASHDILCRSMKELSSGRLLYILVSCLLLILLLVTCLIDDIGPFTIIIFLFQLLATLTIFFCIWMVIIVYKMEYSALFSATRSMEVLIHALINE